MKNLYDKNFQYLKKETEKDIKRWKDHICSQISRTYIVNMASLPKAIYQFNARPIKIPVKFFTDLKRTTFNFIWKSKIPRRAKTILYNKKLPEVLHL